MKTIRLYGDMGKRFGREFQFDVKSPAEAVRALCSQVEGFRAYLHAHAQDPFKVFVGSRNAHDSIQFPCSDREIIRITPVIQGAGNAGRIVLGIILVVVGYLASPMTGGASLYLVGPGIGLIIGGVIGLLTPVPKNNNNSASESEYVENRPSYNFNGPVNTTAQGHPVPLAYGRLIVGSAVISAGMTTV